MTPLSVGSMILGVLILLGVVLFMVLGLYRLLVRVSGWHEITARHPAEIPPPGETLRRQTLMVGAVRFRHSATVVVSAGGLYVELAGGRQRALIPWAELKPLPRRTSQRGRGVRIQVGEPGIGTLAVAPALLARIEPHMGSGAQ